jgi:predicted TIM-barrel fold metal-dependent hydrolase
MSSDHAARGMTVVDVDAHYTGQFDDLVEYIDDELYRSRIEEVVKAGRSPGSIKGFWPRVTGEDQNFRKSHGSSSGGGWSIDDEMGEDAELATSREEVRAVMDKLGIEKIILLGNQMLTFDQLQGRDRRQEIYANAYADYMLDQLTDPERGIYTAVPLPTKDPDAAADLIDRVGDEDGIVAGCFVTSKVEPPLGNRHYDVIYEAAQRAGLPLVFHGGSGGGVDGFYVRGFSRRLSVHALGFLWANMAQLTSLLVQGIPEQYPDLDFVFQESGIFWIPSLMYRLDSEYLRRPNQAPLLEKRPSEYMKEMYYGTQPLDQPPRSEYFRYVIEMLGGPDRLMYASDYPHEDYDTVKAITDLAFLSEQEQAQILGGNAEEVFDI